MVWDNYECENQMSMEEWLWESGYYMPLPVEDQNESRDDNQESEVRSGY